MDKAQGVKRGKLPLDPSLFTTACVMRLSLVHRSKPPVRQRKVVFGLVCQPGTKHGRTAWVFVSQGGEEGVLAGAGAPRGECFPKMSPCMGRKDRAPTAGHRHELRNVCRMAFEGMRRCPKRRHSAQCVCAACLASRPTGLLLRHHADVPWRCHHGHLLEVQRQGLQRRPGRGRSLGAAATATRRARGAAAAAAVEESIPRQMREAAHRSLQRRPDALPTHQPRHTSGRREREEREVRT